MSVGGPPDDADFEARLTLAFESAALSVPDSPGADVLKKAARMALQDHVLPSIENEVHRALKEAADEAAIRVFAENVRRLLLEAPFGPKPVLGVDPGLRTGCKLAAVDAAGAFVANDVIHLQTDEGKAGPARSSPSFVGKRMPRPWRWATARRAARPRCSSARPWARWGSARRSCW